MWKQPLLASLPQQSQFAAAGQRSAAAFTRLDYASTLEILRQLESLTLAHLKSGFEQLFDGADDLLFEMAERAGSNRDQAHYFDAMRMLRVGRRGVEKTYLKAVTAGFSAPMAKSAPSNKPNPVSPELCLKDLEALERTLAVESLVSKAQDHCNYRLWELDRRLARLIHERGATLPPECASPRNICEAFAQGVATLDAGMTITLIIYQLFERRMPKQLDELYVELLKLLSDNGVDAESTPAAPHAVPPTTFKAVSVADTMRVVKEPNPVDRSPPAPEPVRQNQVHADRKLAADLEAAAVGLAVPGWSADQAQGYVQRADTVGNLFNTMLAEPALPRQLATRFDDMRFSVVKTAVRDSSFFENPAHPARTMVNELATLASNARAMSRDSLQRIEEVVDQLRGEFEKASTSLRPPVEESSAPIDLIPFLDDQLVQNRDRRRMLILKVRRVVAEELQLRTAGRALPPGAIKLLHSGWAPMVARGILQQGINGWEWKQGMERLQEVLKVLESGTSVAPGAADQLIAKLEQDFNSAGFADTKIRELLDGFRTAVEEAANHPASLTPGTVRHTDQFGSSNISVSAASDPADAQSLLQMLLVPGAWFRVQHPQFYGRRWLKAAPFQVGGSTVSFLECDGRESVTLNREAFLQQVLEGDITPLELSALARRSIDRYVAAQYSTPLIANPG